MTTLKSNTIFDERQPEIEITASNREAVIERLNRLLADEHVLMLKTHNYHWNVLGPSFDPMHKFFGEQYEMLDDIVDDVAERARALGGKAVGTMREYLQLTRLSEHPGEYPDVMTMIANLLADHETIIRELRKDIDDSLEKYGDVGTSDFLTDLIRQHEKMAWFLRSFLQE
ncbi:Dps family protein [Bellilinea sp.]|jgi:starvation-inducible DNA-binding protein|uniref:DNA starvation/stationary phase protection protein n=1 Tax=Bellilinea caldifistulae TaxID=360411 RepID=A0A7C4Q8S4_9CHLR